MRVQTVATPRKSPLVRMPNGIKRRPANRGTGYALLLAAVVLLIICYIQIGPFPPSAFFLLICSGLLFWAGWKMIRRKTD